MVKTHSILVQELNNYASPKAKITNMIKNHEIIQIKKGLFFDPQDTTYSTFSLSALIYGPSYVSFQSAMSFYGLIPERTDAITCAVYNKTKIKKFVTPAGNFYYYHVPVQVFPHDIIIQKENEQNYLIATPEKAICDSIYQIKSLKDQSDIDSLLQDWRIDLELLKSLDQDSLQFLLPQYRRKSCDLLQNWLIGRF
ncbi:MAG: hypothetical protein RAP03_01970 [Candidatus Electryonea clarkiae]|nr:hypothetical protein [Candidatus Electryonea clarkiae]